MRGLSPWTRATGWRYRDISRQKRSYSVASPPTQTSGSAGFPQIRYSLWEKGHRTYIRAWIVCSHQDLFLFILFYAPLCPETLLLLWPRLLLWKYLLCLYIAHIRPVRILNIPHSFIPFVIVNPLESLFCFNQSLDSFFIIFLIIIPKKGTLWNIYLISRPCQPSLCVVSAPCMSHSLLISARQR